MLLRAVTLAVALLVFGACKQPSQDQNVLAESSGSIASAAAANSLHSSGIALTFAQFKSALRTGDNPTGGISIGDYDYFLFYYSFKGCLYCRLPRTKSILKSLIEESNGRYLVVKVDTTEGKTEDIEWAQKLGVQAFPSFTVLVAGKGTTNFEFYANGESAKNGAGQYRLSEQDALRSIRNHINRKYTEIKDR